MNMNSAKSRCFCWFGGVPDGTDPTHLGAESEQHVIQLAIALPIHARRAITKLID